MKKLAIGLLVITLTVCLAVPAMAEFQPYASLRLITGWYDVDDEDAPGASKTTDDLFWELGDFSRFGAKFSSGDLSGHVEFGIRGDGGDNSNKTYDRLLYGTWKFEGGSLMVGQNYTPYTFISSQIAPRVDLHTDNSEKGGTRRDIDGENYFIGYGCLWDSRQPQIRVKLDNGFYVALVQPEKGSESDFNAALNNLNGIFDPKKFTDYDVDVESDLPKMVIGWEFKTEGLMLNPGFGYNTYEVDTNVGDEDIDSWLLYLNGKAALGMVDLQWSIHYGQNLGDYGLWSREDAAYAQPKDDGDIEDSDCYGGYVQVAIPIDPATITLGVGYTQSENDEMIVGYDSTTKKLIRDDDEDEQMSYFIQVKLPVTDNFWVVPEFSYYDHMEDAAGNDEPTSWFAGLMWRMDF